MKEAISSEQTELRVKELLLEYRLREEIVKVLGGSDDNKKKFFLSRFLYFKKFKLILRS
ncbi:MAG: hypothetical protein IC227_10635 [Enterococcus lacertideformus]|uniref:Uncharacterized protein n=1 Tax=Enterococcus lacertideformus TaxID=2771493 RepID=A0A931AWS3_9ENTE|nr:hypothetical protein [Enterococcus lacertideformus]